jgi:hypothetical protein
VPLRLFIAVALVVGVTYATLAQPTADRPLWPAIAVVWLSVRSAWRRWSTCGVAARLSTPCRARRRDRGGIVRRTMTTSSSTAPAPDEWSVQAGAVLTATPSIATHADAHDAVFDTTIDGHRAWVLLPDGPDSARDVPAHEAGDLRPPSTMDTRLLAAFTGRLGTSPWGYVTRPRTGESWVRRLVVQFDDRVPRGPMADALGRWGRLLTLWLEVWTGQSLDEHNVPTAGPMPPMIVHLGDDGVVGLGPYMMQVVIEPQHDVERAAYRADWAKAVDLERGAACQPWVPCASSRSSSVSLRIGSPISLPLPRVAPLDSGRATSAAHPRSGSAVIVGAGTRTGETSGSQSEGDDGRRT